VQLVRRTLAATVFLYAPDHQAKMQGLLGIHIFFLIAHTAAWPYSSFALNITEFSSLVIICGTAISLLSYEPAYTDSQIIAYSAFLFAILIFMLTLAIKIGPSIEASMKSRHRISCNQLYAFYSYFRNL